VALTFTTISCVIVRCDGCGRPLEFDADDTAHYPTQAEATGAARACGWWITDHFHSCGPCADQRTRREPGGGG
jgi:hypothetical protein